VIDRKKMIDLIYSALDRDDLYDDEGLLHLHTDIKEDPWVLPDKSDTGAPAILADAVLAHIKAELENPDSDARGAARAALNLNNGTWYTTNALADSVIEAFLAEALPTEKKN
jgi:hypothetical protein